MTGFQHLLTADTHTIASVRVASVAICRMFDEDPELVRQITIRQNWIDFELYELDEKGGKQVVDGKPVTWVKHREFI
jgi:hypothetical protein